MWNWFLSPAGRQKKQEKMEAAKKLQFDLKITAEAPRLHGINLNDFHYLGLTQIFYVNEHSVKTNASIFFFVHKTTSLRKFVLKSPAGYWKTIFENHDWVTTEAELWAANERDLYQIIRSEPSNYLEEYMLEKYDSVWDMESKWWKKSNKYDSAVKKASKETHQKVKSEGNILKLDFSRNKDN